MGDRKLANFQVGALVKYMMEGRKF
jgi:hypothetical protein